MPIIVNQPLGVPRPISTRGGWTAQQLIELADRRTERRGSKVLDLRAEFLLALQEFCLEARWPWRRKTTEFTTTAGSWQYDLSDPNNANAADLHQFVQHGVKIYNNPGNPTAYVELPPLFERDQQDSAIFSNSNNPPLVTGLPQRYFMMPGDFLTLVVTPVPDQTYPIQVAYWAVPAPTSDSLPEVIPLVPGFLHHVLLKKLEASIFRFTLGEGNAKYMAVSAEYQKLIDKYQLTSGFVPGERTDWTGAEDYSNDGTSIQSTR